MPASWSDYPDRYRDFRLGRVWMTPYPSMLPALVAVMAVADLVAGFRPATARVAAMVAALAGLQVAGLQVAGIVVVAHRDWWNLAGADGASYHRAAVGSLVATIMGAAAVAAVVVSVLLYRTGRGLHRPRVIQVVGGIVAGAGSRGRGAGVVVRALALYEHHGGRAVRVVVVAAVGHRAGRCGNGSRLCGAAGCGAEHTRVRATRSLLCGRSSLLRVRGTPAGLGPTPFS
jgi:hypothetical protein